MLTEALVSLTDSRVAGPCAVARRVDGRGLSAGVRRVQPRGRDGTSSDATCFGVGQRLSSSLDRRGREPGRLGPGDGSLHLRRDRGVARHELSGLPAGLRRHRCRGTVRTARGAMGRTSPEASRHDRGRPGPSRSPVQCPDCAPGRRPDLCPTAPGSRDHRLRSAAEPDGQHRPPQGPGHPRAAHGRRQPNRHYQLDRQQQRPALGRRPTRTHRPDHHTRPERRGAPGLGPEPEPDPATRTGPRGPPPGTIDGAGI